MPIPLFRYRVRRQRTLDPLVQNLGIDYLRYRYANGDRAPGWVDVTTPMPATKRVGDQLTDSEEHSGWRQRIKDANSLQDIGGDFFTQKHYATGIPTLVDIVTPSTYVTAGVYSSHQYKGPVWAIDARQYPFPPGLHSTDAQLDALGATAFSRCKPTNSPANLAVAFGEIVREGIPKLAVSTWKGRATSLKREQKTAAGNYLSYQFGLAPLGQEIGTFAADVSRSDQLLTQYERDAGKVVRRRYEFPTKTEASISTVAANHVAYMGVPTTGMLNTALTTTQHRELKVLREVQQKRWFSGAFTYYLPVGYDARNELERKALLAKEILGADLLDLETIWNLTPWSWAIDWFSNAGDVISNVMSYAEDGLIMRYGYMMENTIVKDTYTRAYPNTLVSGKNLDSYVTLVTETKIRRRANPFGFGVSFGALSKFQTSILIALGLSRR